MLDIQIEQKSLREITRFSMELPGDFARARHSALSSLGFAVRQEIKREGQRGSKGGYLGWGELSPHTGILGRMHHSTGPLERKREKYRSGDKKGQVIPWRSALKEPFIKLPHGIRYHVDSEDLFVEIGFINPSSRFHTWMRMHDRGYSTRVTPRMRKMFFALGFPIKKETTELKTPARPWVKAVEQRWRPRYLRYFEDKFWESFNRYQKGGSKRAKGTFLRGGRR